MATIYDFKVLSNRGKEMNLADYKGQVILIVNTASKCGFTLAPVAEPKDFEQYIVAELEK